MIKNIRLYRIILFLIMLTITAGCQSRTETPQPTEPVATATPATNSALFPYQKIEKLGDIKFKEPSGITYHPQRDTLFVVGDSGMLTEVKSDGTLVRQEKVLGGASFERVTGNPATGLLYVALEGHDKILEMSPDEFTVLRDINIDRMFEGKELIKKGGGGLEGIVFVPNNSGGTFYLTNQSDELTGNDPSIIFEVEFDESADKPVARIVRYFSTGVTDMSGLFYLPDKDQLLVISDDNNLLLTVSPTGEVLQTVALPGKKQEGIALDGQGNLYIAEDSDSVVKYAPMLDGN